MHTPAVLVTGAAGFIGSHLTERLLRQGRCVVGVDNFCDHYDPAVKRLNLETARRCQRFELVEIDIRDRQVVLETLLTHRPEAIVHLAAMAGVRPSIEQPGYYTAVNVSGTVNLLDAAVKSGCRKFLFASSSSVYGNNDKVPFAEQDPVDRPISPYAATKKAAELICHTYWHLHELPIFCLRFFTVFGPRQRPDLAIHTFLRRICDDKPIAVFGDVSTSRDYTFVDDIIDGVLAALQRCNCYRIYNLGGSTPVRLCDLIAIVEKVAGRSAKIERLPMQPGDVRRTWADLTRSEAELGYQPKISIEDGVARQWAWMQQQDRQQA